MVDMTTTENGLILELQVFKANRTRLIDLTSLQEDLFDVTPVFLSERFRRLINKPEPFCQTEIIDVLHTLLLDVIVSALFSHLTIKKHLFNCTSRIFTLGRIDYCLSLGSLTRTCAWILHPHNLQSCILQVGCLSSGRILGTSWCGANSRIMIHSPSCFRFEWVKTFNFEALHDLLLVILH